MSQIAQVGKYSVYAIEGGEGFYFEHDEFGEERAVAVHIKDNAAYDYEGLGWVPKPALEWLKAAGVNVEEIE